MNRLDHLEGGVEWGVVDCASLIIMERLGCKTVFAYDRHFVEASQQRGFVVL